MTVYLALCLIRVRVWERLVKVRMHSLFSRIKICKVVKSEFILVICAIPPICASFLLRKSWWERWNSVDPYRWSDRATGIAKLPCKIVYKKGNRNCEKPKKTS